MSFKYPSIEKLTEQIQGDLKESLKDPRYLLPGSPLHAISHALAGVAYMLHAHIEHVGRVQLLPDQAQGEDLDRWGALFNVKRVDGENAHEYRERILFRLKHPPRGGTVSDYIAWSKEIPFVKNVWISPAFQGPGSVGVSFLNGEMANPIPTPEQKATLQAHLDSKKPAGSRVVVYTPNKRPIKFSITTQTEQYRPAIERALQQLLFTSALPGKTLYHWRVYQVLVQTVRGEYIALNSPKEDIVFPYGEVGILESIEWKTQSIPH